ncbi:uncharacterized protein LOC121792541 [Salvia splendens]|uniref:uncharacterized protein LOC121792541 n=1 Tax=Salvia splendens TaxID=180675 RepID=UPI001C260746|nr:uncharacterized protein LOC121792541 [Salvia splendens]
MNYGVCGTAKKPSSLRAQKPESNEFISALAAGMSAKLIVQVTSEVSPFTVALAAAAWQTGGKLVCILPESRETIEELGLSDMVEFKTGGPCSTMRTSTSPLLTARPMTMTGCRRRWM